MSIQCYVAKKNTMLFYSIKRYVVNLSVAIMPYQICELILLKSVLCSLIIFIKDPKKDLPAPQTLQTAHPLRHTTGTPQQVHHSFPAPPLPVLPLLACSLRTNIHEEGLHDRAWGAWGRERVVKSVGQRRLLRNVIMRMPAVLEKWEEDFNCREKEEQLPFHLQGSAHKSCEGRCMNITSLPECVCPAEENTEHKNTGFSRASPTFFFFSSLPVSQLFRRPSFDLLRSKK